METPIFLNPLDEESTSRDYALGEITQMIDSTEVVLSIAIAYFTYPAITEALVRRTKHGRQTKLLLNTSDILRPLSSTETEIVISRNLMGLLKLNGPLDVQSLGFQSKRDYQNMHHKFMVSPSRLIFGSLNWTHSALHKNFEVVIVSDTPNLIDSFIREFDNLWAHSEIFFTPNGKVRMIMCPICKTTDCVDFESWGPFCIQCNHKFRVV